MKGLIQRTPFCCFASFCHAGMLSFGICMDTVGQQNHWDKCECNTIKGTMGYKELSLRLLDRLLPFGHYMLKFQRYLWLVLLFQLTLPLFCRSNQCALLRATYACDQLTRSGRSGRWPCRRTRNSTIFSLWKQKRALTLMYCSKLVDQWWKCLIREHVQVSSCNQNQSHKIKYHLAHHGCCLASVYNVMYILVPGLEFGHNFGPESAAATQVLMESKAFSFIC